VHRDDRGLIAMERTTLAAIDVGTNSFHLIVARVGAAGRFEIVTREREMVRLGHGGGDMKVLDKDAIDRGVAALRRMRQIADASGAPVRAVATSAVREADNANEFISRAATEAGVEIEVVSGVEEARLIHLGVLQAVPLFDQRLILFDIGGGSTEVLIGERGTTLTARSFKLGAVRLTDRFFPGGRIQGDAIADCRSHLRSMLVVFQREVAATGFEVAVASSGTAEAVMRMVHAATGAEPLRTYNRFEITRADIADVVRRVTRARTAQRRAAIPGLDAGRADIVVAGSLIFEAVCDVYGIESVLFSDYALREGVLLDTISRQSGGTLHHLRDVSRLGVRHLAERCDDDLAHSSHVA
jgi:exopolyphosphatase/guanosine-5'-triphosphate,3'-diphosphate pyrophosphatase